MWLRRMAIPLEPGMFPESLIFLEYLTLLVPVLVTANNPLTQKQKPEALAMRI
jgi:hypothetical protein